MYRRYMPLEAWEFRALLAYARRSWGGTARQQAALLQAERLARMAHLRLCGQRRSGAPHARLPRRLLRCPATRLEYRLYALFAD